MKRDIIRAVCLISVTAGLYRNDLETGLAFLSLMAVIFWAIPEVLCYLTKGSDET